VDQLRQSVLLDPLTGIGNRVHCETKLKSAMMEFHQHGYPFGLLFLDIDRFKSINPIFRTSRSRFLRISVSRHLLHRCWCSSGSPGENCVISRLLLPLSKARTPNCS
jgi:GGDEF domain-containing protein